MRLFSPPLACLIILGLAVPAPAAITILQANGQPIPPAAAQVAYDSKTGGWNITLLQLYAPFNDSVFNIYANAGEIIDSITISIDGPPAGSPVIVRAQGQSPGHLRTVRQIVQTGTAETILAKVVTTEDIGTVQVEAIGQLIAGRDLRGPVVATTGNNAARGITDAVAGRHILGDLLAENGRIGLVWAQSGNVGAAGAPIDIRARHNVLHVQAQQIHAHIHTRTNGGTGGLYALVGEQFHGSLLAEALVQNPSNGIHGHIQITQQFTGQVTLGKFFTNANQFIQAPVQGLASQIIINADNAALPSGGGWTAPVRIGPNGHPDQIVLNSPQYGHVPSAIGGGSVGLVPFRLHDQGCVPPNGALVQLPTTAPPLVVHLRHYGPVVWSGGVPVNVERRPTGTSQAFVAVSLDEFAATRSAADPNIVTVTAAPNRSGFARGYDYRLTPAPVLRCEVPAAPSVLWPQPYHITVASPPCVGDVTGDSLVNVSDLLAIIAFWGPAPPAFPQVDINGDGAVNVTDLLLVINNWGSCR